MKILGPYYRKWHGVGLDGIGDPQKGQFLTSFLSIVTGKVSKKPQKDDFFGKIFILPTIQCSYFDPPLKFFILETFRENPGTFSTAGLKKREKRLSFSVTKGGCSLSVSDASGLSATASSSPPPTLFRVFSQARSLDEPDPRYLVSQVGY